MVVLGHLPFQLLDAVGPNLWKVHFFQNLNVLQNQASFSQSKAAELRWHWTRITVAAKKPLRTVKEKNRPEDQVSYDH